MSADPEILPPTDPPSTSGPIAPGSGLPVPVAAGVASLVPLVGGLVFFFLDRKDAFVRYYAIQSIVLGAVAILFWVLGAVLKAVLGILMYIPIIGTPLFNIFMFVLNLIALVWTIVWVITTISAFRGKQWKVPWLGAILKRYISRIP